MNLLYISFNPCFLGTCPRIAFSCRGPKRLPKVSILVFLELALGFDEKMVPDLISYLFQSLFSWNLPSDRRSSEDSGAYLGVSILVFLELALGCDIAPASWPDGIGFNPCFLGTCPRMPILLSSLRISSGSFNPCFLGTCPRIGNQVAANKTATVFQSLFSWNLPSDFTLMPSTQWLSDRFNPCFLGTCPRMGGRL